MSNITKRTTKLALLVAALSVTLSATAQAQPFVMEGSASGSGRTPRSVSALAVHTSIHSGVRTIRTGSIRGRIRTWART